MKIRWLALLLVLIAPTTWADGSYFINGDGTDIIIVLCVPELNGEGCLHLDEDIANLEIEVAGSDGVSDALYDVGGEIEDVAAPGTGAHTDPSANNVRVSPTGRSLDTTEFQFADAVFDGSEIKTLCVNDGETTIMGVCWQIFWTSDSTDNRADFQAEIDENNLTTETYLDTRSLLAASYATASGVSDLDTAVSNVDTDVGTLISEIGTAGDGLTAIPGLSAFNPVNTTIAAYTSNTVFTITAGSADDDAYNPCAVMITDQSTATQIAWGDVLDYTGATKSLLLTFDPGVFTYANGDLVTITCLGK